MSLPPPGSDKALLLQALKHAGRLLKVGIMRYSKLIWLEGFAASGTGSLHPL